MAVTSQIALRIAGTKQRQAGFAPLVTVGVLAGGEGNNMDQVPLVNDKPGYIIKHAEDYILYLLIDRRVKSFDADAPGVLSIALSLARDVQLAGGRSPYTLLKEVYETFRSTYMTPVGDDRDSFVNTDIDNEIFREIIQRYPVEKRVGAFIPMNASGLSGTLCVPEDKMEAFFRDTQYPEFAAFKDIHVSNSCQNYPGLEGREIPRPVSYEIYVNGAPTGKKLVRPDDMYQSGLQSTKYIEYSNISFTLNEVLKAPDYTLQIGTASVKLDPATSQIQCTIPKRDIMYKVVLVCSGGNENDQRAVSNEIKNGNIRVLMDSEDITELKEIKAAEQVGKEFTTYPKSTEKFLFTVKPTIDPAKRELRVKILITRKAITPAPQPRPTRQPLQPQNNFTPEPAPPYDDERPTSFMGRLGMDWKSLILGLILGLLLGIAGGWYIGSAGQDAKNTPPATNPNPVPQQGGDGQVEVLSADPNAGTGAVDGTIAGADAANAAAEQTQREAEMRAQQGVGAASVGTAEEEAKKKAEAEAKRKAEAKKKAEDEAKKKAEDEAKQKAEQQQVAAAQAAQAAQAKAEILQMVNQRQSIAKIRAHQGWPALSNVEQLAVETVYNLGNKKGASKQKVKDYLEGKTFNSWDELKTARQEIIAIE